MIRWARALVRRRKEQGADLIKIFASKSQRVGAGPTFTEEQLHVLCSEAASLGLRAMVHAYRSQSAAAARAGCRQVEHLTYGTQADLDAIVKAGAFIGPQAGLAREVVRDVKAEDAPALIEHLLTSYLAQRASAQETFLNFARRHDTAALKTMAETTA